jgi:hypothetical protein
MVGKSEYTAAGRYQIIPVESLFYEVIRPWIFNLPFIQWGPLPSWLFVLLGFIVVVYACTRKNWVVDLSGFRVFGYLLVASVLLYTLASILIFKLFVPSRYTEFSINIFYCLAVAVCLRVAMQDHVSERVMFPLVTTLFFVLAGLRLYHVGIYDYFDQVRLYKYLQSTPKNSLIAGPPDVMDNVITFAHRKAFVTYELAHTWYISYWDRVKKRHFDFFRAYYSDDPEEIRRFCRDNQIDYLVVREEDFFPRRLVQGDLYFEPFDTYIRDILKSHHRFALLNTKAFPPVYWMDGIRVIRIDHKHDTVRERGP